ncbi:MAG: M20/M25/M40 family metallo-hydrolase [Pseudomonadota bacterium]
MSRENSNLEGNRYQLSRFWHINVSQVNGYPANQHRQSAVRIMLTLFMVLICSSAKAQIDGSLTVTSVDEIHRTPIMREVYTALGSRHDLSIETMIELNEIPAPPFEERARALRLAQMFKALGIEDVRIDEVGNVIARRPGLSRLRTIAVIAHVDTVFPAGTDVTVKRTGKAFRAPGVGDNARGLALMLDIAASLESAALKTDADILFVGSVGEEGLGDLRGVRALFGPGGTDVDAAVVIDGGPFGWIVNQSVGSVRYRVTFKGPGGHSYGSFGRAHPHQALADAISRFSAAARAITGMPGPKTTFSVGRIGGGTSVNSIPFESWMEVDMRSVDPDRMALLDAALHAAVEQALVAENSLAVDDSEVTAVLESVGQRPAGMTDPDAPIVKRALDSLLAMDVEGQLTASSTDANIPMSLGIPAVTISRGGISRFAHALNETWEDNNTDRAASAATLLVVAEAGLVLETVLAGD